MEIIPAIDLRGGRCVRLYQGDYTKETVFSDDPLSVALSFEKEGAKRLHVVDLDGARTGAPVNEAILRQIAGKLKIPVQTGGGIRDIPTMERLLGYGISRVILGTTALDEKLTIVKEAAKRFGEKVMVSLDTRGGKVAGQGWQETSDMDVIQLAFNLKEAGIKRFVYTDISRDGTLTQPDYQGLKRLIDACKLPVIASGGVSKLEHIKKLKETGAEAAIIGRALYSGDINLRKALKLSGEK